MSRIRKKWQETVLKYKLNPDVPGSETIWSPDLETISGERIKEIQSEKLSVAFEYLYEESAYYQEKFKQIKLKP
ncbi:MAG: hypothetical protein GY797_12675, partial [Deltaproteobacteria bacterium]|nr:hypothetical protein [Deltaproteobacteria bacterium]